eukprot:8701611-Alexandrium_andersonii.AAC.1
MKWRLAGRHPSEFFRHGDTATVVSCCEQFLALLSGGPPSPRRPRTSASGARRSRWLGGIWG